MGKILKPETIWPVIREESFALRIVKVPGVLMRFKNGFISF
jgi:hypothetical protein